MPSESCCRRRRLLVVMGFRRVQALLAEVGRLLGGGARLGKVANPAVSPVLIRAGAPGVLAFHPARPRDLIRRVICAHRVVPERPFSALICDILTIAGTRLIYDALV